MKRTHPVCFDLDMIVWPDRAPKLDYPAFCSAPGCPTSRRYREGQARRKPWPEPLRGHAPPPCSHRSPLIVRSTPSLQPRSCELVGSYTQQGLAPVTTSHFDTASAGLPNGYVIRYAASSNAMSKTVDTQHKKCSLCLSSPLLTRTARRCPARHLSTIYPQPTRRIIDT
jgi:hypothetical protein